MSNHTNDQDFFLGIAVEVVLALVVIETSFWAIQGFLLGKKGRRGNPTSLMSGHLKFGKATFGIIDELLFYRPERKKIQPYLDELTKKRKLMYSEKIDEIRESAEKIFFSIDDWKVYWGDFLSEQSGKIKDGTFKNVRNISEISYYFDGDIREMKISSKKKKSGKVRLTDGEVGFRSNHGYHHFVDIFSKSVEEIKDEIAEEYDKSSSKKKSKGTFDIKEKTESVVETGSTIVSLADTFSAAWCPDCSNKMEGGPYPKSWYCGSCAQIFDEKGVAIN